MQFSTNEMSKLFIMNTALSSNLFLFVAKTTSWPDDNNPPSTNTVTLNDFQDDIIFLKRIHLNDVRYMITRTNWVSGNKTAGQFILTSNFYLYYVKTSGTNTIKPSHLSGVSTSGGTAEFEFIKVLSSFEQTEFLEATKVPLSSGEEKYFNIATINQIKIKAKIIGTEFGNLPLNRSFRIVGLYVNPYDRTEIQNTFDYKNEIKNYGKILTFKAISPYVRTEEQINTYLYTINLS